MCRFISGTHSAVLLSISMTHTHALTNGCNTHAHTLNMYLFACQPTCHLSHRTLVAIFNLIYKLSQCNIEKYIHTDTYMYADRYCLDSDDYGKMSMSHRLSLKTHTKKQQKKKHTHIHKYTQMDTGKHIRIMAGYCMLTHLYSSTVKHRCRYMWTFIPIRTLYLH